MAQRRRQRRGRYESARCREHLCYIESQGFHLGGAREPLAPKAEARYGCTHCGRTARTPTKLCVAVLRHASAPDITAGADDETAADSG